eukprot:GEMP01064535.1.p1 GENE.GEMP01064535.1~~GEMP01064535.1.p1  ORF type:complete len:205 (+),score=30.36 GEMP01064535.1:81-695(+)
MVVGTDGAARAMAASQTNERQAFYRMRQSVVDPFSTITAVGPTCETVMVRNEQRRICINTRNSDLTAGLNRMAKDVGQHEAVMRMQTTKKEKMGNKGQATLAALRKQIHKIQKLETRNAIESMGDPSWMAICRRKARNGCVDDRLNFVPPLERLATLRAIEKSAFKNSRCIVVQTFFLSHYCAKNVDDIFLSSLCFLCIWPKWP